MTTNDLPTAERFLHLLAALYELDARIRAPDVPEGLAFSHDGRSLSAARVWNLVTSHGPVDLTMVPDGTEDFEDLVRSAQAIEAFGAQVLVASLRDIIRRAVTEWLDAGRRRPLAGKGATALSLSMHASDEAAATNDSA